MGPRMRPSFGAHAPRRSCLFVRPRRATRSGRRPRSHREAGDSRAAAPPHPLPLSPEAGERGERSVPGSHIRRPANAPLEAAEAVQGRRQDRGAVAGLALFGPPGRLPAAQRGLKERGGVQFRFGHRGHPGLSSNCLPHERTPDRGPTSAGARQVNANRTARRKARGVPIAVCQPAGGKAASLQGPRRRAKSHSIHHCMLIIAWVRGAARGSSFSAQVLPALRFPRAACGGGTS
jgi:hypothetical protein